MLEPNTILPAPSTARPNVGTPHVAFVGGWSNTGPSLRSRITLPVMIASTHSIDFLDFLYSLPVPSQATDAVRSQKKAAPTHRPKQILPTPGAIRTVHAAHQTRVTTLRMQLDSAHQTLAAAAALSHTIHVLVVRQVDFSPKLEIAVEGMAVAALSYQETIKFLKLCRAGANLEKRKKQQEWARIKGSLKEAELLQRLFAAYHGLRA